MWHHIHIDLMPYVLIVFNFSVISVFPRNCMVLTGAIVWRGLLFIVGCVFRSSLRLKTVQPLIETDSDFTEPYKNYPFFFRKQKALFLYIEQPSYIYYETLAGDVNHLITYSPSSWRIDSLKKVSVFDILLTSRVDSSLGLFPDVSS